MDNTLVELRYKGAIIVRSTHPEVVRAVLGAVLAIARRKQATWAGADSVLDLLDATEVARLEELARLAEL